MSLKRKENTTNDDEKIYYRLSHITNEYCVILYLLFSFLFFSYSLSRFSVPQLLFHHIYCAFEYVHVNKRRERKKKFIKICANKNKTKENPCICCNIYKIVYAIEPPSAVVFTRFIPFASINAIVLFSAHLKALYSH